MPQATGSVQQCAAAANAREPELRVRRAVLHRDLRVVVAAPLVAWYASRSPHPCTLDLRSDTPCVGIACSGPVAEHVGDFECYKNVGEASFQFGRAASLSSGLAGPHAVRPNPGGRTSRSH